jgi:hypothetical protein
MPALLYKTPAVRAFSDKSDEKVWKVYLSGEIHSDWREVIADGVKKKDLPVSMASPPIRIMRIVMTVVQ